MSELVVIRPVQKLSEGVVTVTGMIIDCDSCQMRDVACDDCVVTVLLAAPRLRELADDEAGALAALADGGLVPPLRMRYDAYGA
jgi:hypothetical protein